MAILHYIKIIINLFQPKYMQPASSASDCPASAGHWIHSHMYSTSTRALADVMYASKAWTARP